MVVVTICLLVCLFDFFILLFCLFGCFVVVVVVVKEKNISVPVAKRRRFAQFFCSALLYCFEQSKDIFETFAARFISFRLTY